MKIRISILVTTVLLLSCIAFFSACTNEEPYDSPNPSASTTSLIPPYEGLGTTSTTALDEGVGDSEVFEEDSEPTASIGLEFEKDSHNPYYVVTGIGVCTDTTVYIPDQYEGLPVKAIGSKAFQFCTSFTKIILPDTIESIGHNAFYKCTSLREITLSSNLKSIGSEAFMFSGITSISIPEKVETLFSSAFQYCFLLENVTISSSRISHIPEKCFASCSYLNSITIPEGVRTIGEDAFYSCDSLSSITLPDTLQRIDAWCFYNCTSLNDITIPKNVTDVNYCAFKDCGEIDIYCYADIELPSFVDVSATIHYK